MAKEPKRGHTITPQRWWVDEVGRRRKTLGLSQEKLVELVLERAAKRAKEDPEERKWVESVAGPLGDVDQSRVSRCLRGDSSPIGLLWLVSSIVGVPPPVIIPRELHDARQINSFVVELSGSIRTGEMLREAEAEISDLRAESLTISKKRQPAGQGPVVLPPSGKPTRRRS